MSKFKIRDDTIINIIKDILKTVEGPISYCLLKPTDKMKDILGSRPPVIILFGDNHKGDQKCIPDCKEEDGCLSFYGGNHTIHNFFSYMSRIAHVDVFLEVWYEKVERKLGRIKYKNKDQNSALIEFIKFTSPCFNLKDKKDCQVKDYYIHMADPRYKYDPRNIDTIFEIITKYDLPMFRLQVDVLLQDKEGNSPDYRKIIMLALQALEVGTKEFMKNVFRYNPIIQTFSKTYKQLSKLPDKLQDLIYNNFFDTIQLLTEHSERRCLEPHFLGVDIDYKKIEYPADNLDNIKYEEGEMPIEEIYKVVKKILNTHPLQGHKERSICSLIGITGLDLYYLGRTLKKPKDGTPSEISVGYFGANHVKNIMNFLVKNGLYTLQDKYVVNDSKCLRLA